MTPSEAFNILNRKATVEDSNFQQSLKAWHRIYYEMSLHTLGIRPKFTSPRTGEVINPINCREEYQFIFDNMLFARHPSESEESRNYRYSVYRPLTQAPLLRLTELVTSAIFQDSEYDIEIQDETDNKYIWSNVFSGNDIAGYFANIGYGCMIEDPNGYFVRIPTVPADQQPQGEKLLVDIWFVGTKDIIYKDKTSILFKKDDEAFLIDEQDIFRYVKEANQIYGEPEPYFSHNLNRLPITIAGGHWNSYGYYESWYIKAKPTCDEYVSTFSAAQVVDKEASHPIILEPDTDCVECNGSGKRIIQIENVGKEERSCHVCNGSGFIHRNPMQRGLMSRKDYAANVDIKFVNPDISINKHHREVVKELYNNILDALNLTVTEEAQSGVAKAIDQERLYRFIYAISNTLFDKIIYDTLMDIVQYRNVQSTSSGNAPATIPFSIIKPKTFSLETSDTLLEKYENGIKASLPMAARAEGLRKYIDKEYGSSQLLKKKFDFIIYSDPFATATTQELGTLQASPEEIRYHVWLPMWLDKIIEQKKESWFINASTEAIEQEINNYKNTSNGLQ